MPADNARPFDRIVGYVRVSTRTQGISGLGLEAQRAAIEAHARQLGVPVAAIFEEVESGTRSDRPKLAEAVRLCSVTGAALVAAKVDRFGRKAGDLMALRAARFPVIAVDTPSADGFLFGILALVAEKERDSISERTKVALAAAKARGVMLGSPKGFGGKVYREGGKAAERDADDFAKRVLPTIKTMRSDGKGLRQIARELEDMGVKTARGGKWTATAVKNVLKRPVEVTR
jgi:DNA invertase Pin-like site-specific DNA recombinase